jgi:hypothetical protein
MTIVATILTGLRLDLLQRTIGSSRPYLEQCDRVIVFHAANDEETAEYLGGLPFESYQPKELVPLKSAVFRHSNGAATSACAMLAAKTGCELWMHVEDDWCLAPELVAQHPDWFTDAQDVALMPQVGQVRLREERHLGDLVQTPAGLRGVGGCANMNWVDGRETAWQTIPGAKVMLGNAHYTFNPFIMRTALIGGVLQPSGEPIRGVFPADNERHAMARFYALNLHVAQMRPGVYRHIGEGRHVGQH